MIKDNNKQIQFRYQTKQMFSSKDILMIMKFKSQIGTAIFTQNSQEPDYTNRLSHQQCPPLIIGDIVFNLNSLESVELSQKTRVKMMKQYVEVYPSVFGEEKLTVDIVGKTYFLFVKQSRQTCYNQQRWFQQRKRNKTQLKKYENSIREIYENPKMMKHFWSIDFSNLKVLNLSSHNLTSIEGITFLNLPRLQCLELHTNNLQSIDCLSKISTQKLRVLTIYNNRLLTANKLTRMNSKKLKICQIDGEDTIQKQQIEILDFIIKMKSLDSLEEIYMRDVNRIWNRKKMRFLTQRTLKSKVPTQYVQRTSQIPLID